MKNYALKFVVTALAITPIAAQSEVDFGGESYLGYGNAGDDLGGLSTLSIYATNQLEIGALGTLDLKAQANFRSNQDEIGYIDDNHIDFSASLDMGQRGVLSLSTFGTLGQKPWADGEIMDRGSVAVFPAVPRRFRAIGDVAALTVDGSMQKVQEDLRIRYENHFGKLGVEVAADPFHAYGPVSGDDVVTVDGLDRPTIQAGLSYPTEFGIWKVKANDLGDTQIDLIYPIKGSGLVLAGSYASNGDDRELYNADLTAIYHTENAGVFKGFFATYTEGTFDLEKFVLSTEWGGEQWSLKLAGDSDENFAAEASYNISDDITGFWGWDSGHALIEGFDDAYNPPVFAPERSAAYEAGLKITF